jgi:hypothetical protein
VFAQQNCDVSDEGNEADYAANDVFFAVQERLAGSVEFGVVCDVVVALCEQAERCFATDTLTWVLKRGAHIRVVAPSLSQKFKQDVLANGA